MPAKDLFGEGRLTDAIAMLNTAIRDDPTDVRLRTFLFELLCFAGDYDRAAKQLDTLARLDPEATTGILAYQAVLECTGERRRMFESGTFPSGEPPPAVRGTLNGESFESLEDADPRIGARLEVIIAGQYHWLPYEHLSLLSVAEPSRLRELFWAPAELTAAETLKAGDLGEVLLPVMTAQASSHPDELVRLGRATEWVEVEQGVEAPVGQKMLLVDDEVFPILEIRSLEIDGPSG